MAVLGREVTLFHIAVPGQAGGSFSAYRGIVGSLRLCDVLTSHTHDVHDATCRGVVSLT